ncbi:MAG: threonine synthase [Peptostreptococcaceae bacterium]
MLYLSTRGSFQKLTSSQAIINGICSDGGLYVPEYFPNISKDIATLINFNYSDLAFYILSKFLDDFTNNELKYCIDKSYNIKFENHKVAPLSKIGNLYFLELFHGPTLAFKDIALSIMPFLLEIAIRKNHLDKNILILTATSGDTGKAALEGFKNISNIDIMVFFPQDGVSPIQKLQMVTQEGSNTCAVGVKGNFDDVQSEIKKIFNNLEFKNTLLSKNYILSSANSINIGRLLPQIVYYFYSYTTLIRNAQINIGDKINFVVPTGNFGNILAGYYAKLMGLPINKLIVASNDNNILYDFISTGIYDKNRALKLTTSPSMDILLSSNLERLLFEINNRNPNIINTLMSDLELKNKYSIDYTIKKNLYHFDCEYSTCKEATYSIKKVFENYSYLIDTHTAVAYNCYKKYQSRTNDNTKTIIVSTASPYKFAKDVLNAIYNENMLSQNDFYTIDMLSKLSMYDIPTSIMELKTKSQIHNQIINKNEIIDSIKNFIKD